MVRTILIVDEDSALAGNLAAIVHREGSVASTASTFREAVRLLETTRPDVLVTALQLGPYNGLHLMLRGCADHPGLRGIVIGPKDSTIAQEALALGAAAYLALPIEAAAVVDEIRNLSAVAAEDDNDGGCVSSVAAREASVS